MTFDMQKWLCDQAITEVECLVSDISGIPRGKILPVNKFVSAQDTGGLRLPEYVFGQSVTGEYYDSDVLNEIPAGWCRGMMNRPHRLFMMRSVRMDVWCHLQRVQF